MSKDQEAKAARFGMNIEQSPSASVNTDGRNGGAVDGWTARWHREGDDSLILLSHPEIGSVGVHKKPREPGRPLLETMLYDFGVHLLATEPRADGRVEDGITDSQRIDWLEQNLFSFTTVHERRYRTKAAVRPVIDQAMRDRAAPATAPGVSTVGVNKET